MSPAQIQCMDRCGTFKERPKERHGRREEGDLAEGDEKCDPEGVCAVSWFGPEKACCGFSLPCTHR